jgi:hypothetical protein
MEIHHTTILNNSGGLQGSYMPEAVWKNWTPPKFKLFAWLILQTMFGRPTASKSVGGLIAACVSFAKGRTKPRRISSSNVATPCGFGTLLSLG